MFKVFCFPIALISGCYVAFKSLELLDDYLERGSYE